MAEAGAAPARGAVRKGRARFTATGWPALGLVVTIAGWWGVTSAVPLVHPAVLPPPAEVLAAFQVKPAEMLGGLATTTLETVAGFVISAVAGVLIGLLLAVSSAAERMFSPLLVAINAVPKIALGPLLVVSLGWGQRPILTMVVLLSFFPIVLSTTTGLTTTPAELAELARSLDASRWQTFRKVRLPAALPHVFIGLKVAMPLAAIGAVIGEFQAGEGGLGYQIVQYSGIADSATAWAAITLLAAMSVALYSVLVLVERLALPWVRETTSER